MTSRPRPPIAAPDAQKRRRLLEMADRCGTTWWNDPRVQLALDRARNVLQCPANAQVYVYEIENGSASDLTVYATGKQDVCLLERRAEESLQCVVGLPMVHCTLLRQRELDGHSQWYVRGKRHTDDKPDVYRKWNSLFHWWPRDNVTVLLVCAQPIGSLKPMPLPLWDAETLPADTHGILPMRGKLGGVPAQQVVLQLQSMIERDTGDRLPTLAYDLNQTGQKFYALACDGPRFFAWQEQNIVPEYRCFSDIQSMHPTCIIDLDRQRRFSSVRDFKEKADECEAYNSVFTFDNCETEAVELVNNALRAIGVDEELITGGKVSRQGSSRDDKDSRHVILHDVRFPSVDTERKFKAILRARLDAVRPIDASAPPHPLWCKKLDKQGNVVLEPVIDLRVYRAHGALRMLGQVKYGSNTSKPLTPLDPYECDMATLIWKQSLASRAHLPPTVHAGGALTDAHAFSVRTTLPSEYAGAATLVEVDDNGNETFIHASSERRELEAKQPNVTTRFQLVRNHRGPLRGVLHLTAAQRMPGAQDKRQLKSFIEAWLTCWFEGRDVDESHCVWRAIGVGNDDMYIVFDALVLANCTSLYRATERALNEMFKADKYHWMSDWYKVTARLDRLPTSVTGVYPGDADQAAEFDKLRQWCPSIPGAWYNNNVDKDDALCRFRCISSDQLPTWVLEQRGIMAAPHGTPLKRLLMHNGRRLFLYDPHDRDAVCPLHGRRHNKPQKLYYAIVELVPNALYTVQPRCWSDSEPSTTTTTTTTTTVQPVFVFRDDTYATVCSDNDNLAMVVEDEARRTKWVLFRGERDAIAFHNAHSPFTMYPPAELPEQQLDRDGKPMFHLNLGTQKQRPSRRTAYREVTLDEHMACAKLSGNSPEQIRVRCRHHGWFMVFRAESFDDTTPSAAPLCTIVPPGILMTASDIAQIDTNEPALATLYGADSHVQAIDLMNSPGILEVVRKRVLPVFNARIKALCESTHRSMAHLSRIASGVHPVGVWMPSQHTVYYYRRDNATRRGVAFHLHPATRRCYDVDGVKTIKNDTCVKALVAVCHVYCGVSQFEPKDEFLPVDVMRQQFKQIMPTMTDSQFIDHDGGYLSSAAALQRLENGQSSTVLYIGTHGAGKTTAARDVTDKSLRSMDEQLAVLREYNEQRKTSWLYERAKQLDNLHLKLDSPAMANLVVALADERRPAHLTRVMKTRLVYWHNSMLATMYSTEAYNDAMACISKHRREILQCVLNEFDRRLDSFDVEAVDDFIRSERLPIALMDYFQSAGVALRGKHKLTLERAWAWWLADNENKRLVAARENAEALMQLLEARYSVLYIAHLRSLNTTMAGSAEDLYSGNYEEFSLRCYYNDEHDTVGFDQFKNPIGFGHVQRLAISANSLHKIKKRKFDIVITDECEQFQRFLFSKILRFGDYQVWQRYRRVMRDATLLIAADKSITAKVTGRHMATLRPVASIEVHFTTRQNFKRDYIDHVLWASEKEMDETLVRHFHDNRERRERGEHDRIEHAAIAAGVRGKIEQVEQLIQRLDPAARVLVLTGDTVFVGPDKWTNYEYLLYSPKVVSGISFEECHFDHFFMYTVCGDKVPPPDTVHQMMYRIRCMRKTVCKPTMNMCITSAHTDQPGAATVEQHAYDAIRHEQNEQAEWYSDGNRNVSVDVDVKEFCAMKAIFEVERYWAVRDYRERITDNYRGKNVVVRLGTHNEPALSQAELAQLKTVKRRVKKELKERRLTPVAREEQKSKNQIILLANGATEADCIDLGIRTALGVVAVAPWMMAGVTSKDRVPIVQHVYQLAGPHVGDAYIGAQLTPAMTRSDQRTITSTDMANHHTVQLRALHRAIAAEFPEYDVYAAESDQRAYACFTSESIDRYIKAWVRLNNTVPSVALHEIESFDWIKDYLKHRGWNVTALCASSRIDRRVTFGNRLQSGRRVSMSPFEARCAHGDTLRAAAVHLLYGVTTLVQLGPALMSALPQQPPPPPVKASDADMYGPIVSVCYAPPYHVTTHRQRSGDDRGDVVRYVAEPVSWNDPRLPRIVLDIDVIGNDIQKPAYEHVDEDGNVPPLYRCYDAYERHMARLLKNAPAALNKQWRRLQAQLHNHNPTQRGDALVLIRVWQGKWVLQGVSWRTMQRAVESLARLKMMLAVESATIQPSADCMVNVVALLSGAKDDDFNCVDAIHRVEMVKSPKRLGEGALLPVTLSSYIVAVPDSTISAAATPSLKDYWISTAAFEAHLDKHAVDVVFCFPFPCTTATSETVLTPMDVNNDGKRENGRQLWRVRDAEVGHGGRYIIDVSPADNDVKLAKQHIDAYVAAHSLVELLRALFCPRPTDDVTARLCVSSQ